MTISTHGALTVFQTLGNLIFPFISDNKLSPSSPPQARFCPPPPSFCVSSPFGVKCCQWFSFLFQSGKSRMYILTAKIYIYTGILKLIVYMSSRHGITQCKQKVEIIRKIVSPVFAPFEYFVIFLTNLWN